MCVQVKGAISFKNVTFSYPSRADTVVLKNFSLEIKPGETVAFVGDSGRYVWWRVTVTMVNSEWGVGM